MSDQYVIFDKDGVLADTLHRESFLAGKKDWDGFYKASIEDPIIPEGVDLLRQFVADGYKVCIMTGQPSEYTEECIEWIRKNHIHCDKLILQSGDQKVPAHVYKERMLDKVAPLEQIVYAVDDKPKNCEMFQKKGICALCFYAKYEDKGESK